MQIFRKTSYKLYWIIKEKVSKTIAYEKPIILKHQIIKIKTPNHIVNSMKELVKDTTL